MTGDHGQQWPIDEDLTALRERLFQHAAQAGMRGERLDDLLLAVNEAVINVLEHGGGDGTLSISQDETYLTVDITDAAGHLDVRHIPRKRPTGTVRGFGLWLMSQLCDEFTIQRIAGRSRVRLRMLLHRSPDGAASPDSVSGDPAQDDPWARSSGDLGQDESWARSEVRSSPANGAGAHVDIARSGGTAPSPQQS
ncbi:ATP-binding protein [Streptosporangium sp. 'caverna']|uniref:ATP-binding protein n=1 Tax=Streptosporangium sp. 'caverna' TaxID=2202249 RepID=UPI0013A69C17|nr:ATP-binding protein [Streptosporangium sp. 'caverna']